MRLLLLVSIFFVCTISVTGHAQKHKVPEAKDVVALTRKVADWQITTFEDMGTYRALPSGANRKSWHHRNRYHDLEWMPAALYVGMYQWYLASNDRKYADWLNKIGQKHKWQLHERLYHADDHAVGQLYLSFTRFMVIG